ncbi:MAG: hypothetical protein ACI867_001806, partial [Glaciecola sp.]
RLRLQSAQRQLTDEDKARVLAQIAARAESIGASLRN